MFHRNDDVWGDDVLEFKPERWFISRGTTGLFGNTHVSCFLHYNIRTELHFAVLTFLLASEAAPVANSRTFPCIPSLPITENISNLRFVEMQAFLVGMLSRYEFSIPEDAKRVVRLRTFAMLPMVEGEFEHGPQLPIRITALPVLST